MLEFEVLEAQSRQNLNLSTLPPLNSSEGGKVDCLMKDESVDPMLVGGTGLNTQNENFDQLCEDLAQFDSKGSRRSIAVRQSKATHLEYRLAGSEGELEKLRQQVRDLEAKNQ